MIVMKRQFGGCQVIFSIWFQDDDLATAKSFSQNGFEMMIWWPLGHFLEMVLR
jgi:hypothetical protein